MVILVLASVFENRKRDGLSGHRNLKTPMLTIYFFFFFLINSIYLLTLLIFCVLIDTFLCFQWLRGSK